MQSNFIADIAVVEDPDEGLRVECLEPHLAPVSRALEGAGFELGIARIAQQGTANLHNEMELPVLNGLFDDMKDAVYNCLIAAGMSVTPVDLSAVGEKRVRFDLNDVSLFGNRIVDKM